MKNLIPYFNQEKYHQKKYSGWLKGSSMSIDLKGFTKMTEDLMKDGHYGAEILSDIINEVFGPIIELIYKNGGFITAFVGDAVTAVFPKEFAFNAERSANNILKYFEKNKEIVIEKRKFEINVRIGISYGRVVWKIVNVDERSVYFFKGYTVHNAADAQQEAVPGKLKIHKTYSEKDIKYNNTVPKKTKISKKTLKSFAPNTVIDMKTSGEFRDIVSIFISFNERSTDVISFSKFLCSASVEYKGYLNKIDFGDKGGIALVIFGAPLTVERYPEYAMTFAFEMIAKFPFIKVGMAKGVTYCGFVGSEKRSEYTALGETVNLSARLINVTPKENIRTDANIASYEYSGFGFKSAGKYKFKGFNKKQDVFYPIAEDQKKDLKIDTEFIGRDKEFKILNSFVKPIFTGQFAGYMQINGNAGVGKSRLIDALRVSFKTKKIKWFAISCNNIVNKSFQPIISFLKQQIEIPEDMNSSEKIRIFNKYFTYIKSISNVDFSPDDNKKIQFFIGKLLGVNIKNSILEKLSSKEVYENTLFAFRNYILIYCSISPVIFEIDDIYQADDQTIELFRVLSRVDDKTPLCLIASSRYLKNRKAFDPKFKDINQKTIDLRTLNRSSVITISENLLSNKISKKLSDIIWDKTAGNPFYTEQITMYLRESNLLKMDKKIITIDAKEYSIPEKISSIIISRIDKLSSDLKRSIKAASVLGKEFSSMVLTGMLKNENINIHLKLIEKEAFWSNISEVMYIFKHALIRDSIYQMQLKKTLKALHKLAAQTIKIIYKKEMDKHYSDLAFHYEKAKDNKNSYIYHQKAAEYAYSNYHLGESIEHYIKLLGMESELEKIIEFKRLIGEMYVTLGEWEKAEKLFEENLVLLKDINDPELFVKSNVAYATLKADQGNVKKANEIYEECLKISRKNKFKYYEAAILNDIGGVHRLWSDFKKAIEYNKSALKIFEKLKNKSSICSTHDNLGIAYLDMGEFKEAEKHFKIALKIAEDINNLHDKMMVYNNMGSIYYQQGDTKTALNIFSKALNLAVKLSDLQKQGIINGHLGSICFYKGDYDRAFEHFTKEIDISFILGDKIQECYVSGNIGVIHRLRGNNDKAIYYFNRQLELSNILQHKQLFGIANGNLAYMYSLVGDFEKSNKMLDVANKVSLEINDKINASINYSNLGYNYRSIKDFDNSLKFYEKSLKISEDLELKYNLLSIYYYMAELFNEIRNTKKAILYVNKSLKLSKELSRDDYLLKCKTLIMLIDSKMIVKNKEKALLELFNIALNNEQKGLLNKTLFLITKKKKYQTEARRIYKDLYKQFKYYDYKMALEELK